MPRQHFSISAIYQHLLTQPKFWTTFFGGLNFCEPAFFLDKTSFDQNNIWIKQSFYLNVFEPDFFTLNLLDRKSLGGQYFLYIKTFWAFIFLNKMLFGPTFFYPIFFYLLNKIFWDPKIFWTQHLFGPEIFGPKIVRNNFFLPNIFWPNFLDLIFWIKISLNICWSKYFWTLIFKPKMFFGLIFRTTNSGSNIFWAQKYFCI